MSLGFQVHPSQLHSPLCSSGWVSAGSSPFPSWPHLSPFSALWDSCFVYLSHYYSCLSLVSEHSEAMAVFVSFVVGLQPHTASISFLGCVITIVIVISLRGLLGWGARISFSPSWPHCLSVVITDTHRTHALCRRCLCYHILLTAYPANFV